jgi:hypothetical protein
MWSRGTSLTMLNNSSCLFGFSRLFGLPRALNIRGGRKVAKVNLGTIGFMVLYRQAVCVPFLFYQNQNQS